MNDFFSSIHIHFSFTLFISHLRCCYRSFSFSFSYYFIISFFCLFVCLFLYLITVVCSVFPFFFSSLFKRIGNFVDLYFSYYPCRAHHYSSCGSTQWNNTHIKLLQLKGKQPSRIPSFIYWTIKNSAYIFLRFFFSFLFPSPHSFAFHSTNSPTSDACNDNFDYLTHPLELDMHFS